MKTIRFTNDWRYSRKGDVIEEGDGVAELLIARKIAEEVNAEEVNLSGAEEVSTAEEYAGDGAADEAVGPHVITRQLPSPPLPGERRQRGR